jgi:hypothetical protein
MIPNVHDRATAEQFVKACVAEIGLGFHPDTRFEDYVDAGGNRVFSDAEAERLNLMADRAAGFVDMYAIGLDEMRRQADAGSCEYCPGQGGGCIVCRDWTTKPEGK